MARSGPLALLGIALLVGASLASCGGSTKPDATPPAAVTDLTVTAVRDTTVTLTWTAPGDDGTRGRAIAYDLRYGRFSVLTYWDIASPTPTPVPGPPGGTDSVVVTGLVQDAAYNFALRAVDEAGNWSDLSNMASGVPADHIAPATIADLVAEVLDHRAIRLRWTAPGDDGSEGLVEGYDIRYGTSPVTEVGWDTYPQAPFTQMPVVGGQEQVYDLGGLDTTTTYFAAVRAYDEAGNVAGMSNVVMATTPRDTIPPGAVTDLAVRLGTPVAAVLSWTAPGDDGAEGQAASYDVRYAQTPITEATWGSATRAYLTQTPQTAGEPETLTVAPQEGQASYYFALKTTDEVGNTSALSNVPQVETAQSRVWRILADGSGDAPTIQAGIDSAAANDTVLVGPGTYVENLRVEDKDLILRSEMGPEATTVDGSSQQETVVYLSGLTRATEVQGFTITGGIGHVRGAVADGGGFYLTNGSSPVIRGNHIIANGVPQMTYSGGGVAYTPQASPLIEGNLFESNTARLGGALYLTSGKLEIRQNVFRTNTCTYDGGAIYAVLFNIVTGHFTIEDNQFWENYAGDHGGAIHVGTGRSLDGFQVFIRRNLFVRNHADGTGGADNGAGGAVRFDFAHGTIVSNTFVDNLGFDETICGGGSLAIAETPSDLEISGNIIAGSRSCGISCRTGIANTLGPNLFWMNTDGDLGSGKGLCPSDWTQNQIFADPLFCSLGTDDYTVAADSPALTGPVLMGAFTTPGCGLAAATSPRSWGLLKSGYR